MKVNLDYSSYRDVGISNKLIVEIVEMTLAEVSPSFSDVSLSLAIVSNDEIKRLNKQYRNKDEVTDVLSFSGNISEFISEENDLGEIIIAADKCNSQAKNNKKTFRQEFVMLFVHGLLHLLGYDHIEDEEAVVMEVWQSKVLKKINA